MSEEYTPYMYTVVIATPIVVGFGLVGNAMTTAVLTRKRFRSRNISVYLLALAVVDSIFLLSNTMVALTIKFLIGPDVQSLSNVGCKLAKYALMTSRAMSAWLVVVLTAQRLLAMSIPHLASVLSTRRQAVTSTAVVVCFVLALYSYLFYVVELRVEYSSTCFWSASVVDRVRTLLNIADLLFYSLIPSVILGTCNSILIYMLFYSEELRREATKSVRGVRSGCEARSITVVLVLMSVSFILLTLPMTLYQVVYTVGFRPGLPILYPALYTLDIVNHAVNFLLYCVSGPTFRAEIKAMMACGATSRRRKSRAANAGCLSGAASRRCHRRSGDTQSTQDTRVTSAPTTPLSATDGSLKMRPSFPPVGSYP